MKRVALILLVLISLLTAKENVNTTQPSLGAIRTDKVGEKLLERFSTLMERENISIDYSKISSINVLPLHPMYQGLYSRESGVILIQYAQYSFYSEETVEDIWFIILCHEILHSQGYTHTQFGGLMATDDSDMTKAIKTKSAEQFILDTYNIMESLPKIDPSN